MMVKEGIGGDSDEASGGENMIGFPIPYRGQAFKTAAVALAIMSLSATGFWMYHLFIGPQGAKVDGAGNSKSAARLFQNLPKNKQPDLVLVLSGETFSYLQPCGCSSPQHGGLARRYNFIQSLVKGRNWPVVALDLGDVAQKSGPQTLLKYTTMMTALKTMEYAAVAIGRNEMAMPLIDALSEYTLNNPLPRVLAANLLKKEENFPTMVKSFEVVARQGAPKVGVVGVVHPNVGREVNDPSVKFEDVETNLLATLKDLQAKKPEVLVLLFQGMIAEAKKCARQYPQFHVILCLSPEQDPPGTPEEVGRTLIVTVGHKGRFLGTVGVFRTGTPDSPIELYYQLVLLTPEYETPEGKDASNPVHALMEEYAKKVKADNYLAQYPKSAHPIQRELAFKDAVYVGSEKCYKCHEHAYKVWKNSTHSHAYESLEKAARPSLRQYDGESVDCRNPAPTRAASPQGW